MKLIYLVTGGALGTVARFYLSHLVQHPLHRHIYGFPVGTLLVNSLGCYLIGIFVSGADKWGWGTGPRVFLIAGFCGAFTTFSAFMVETVGLWKGETHTAAFLNVVLSLAIGLACFMAGAWTARAL